MHPIRYGLIVGSQLGWQTADHLFIVETIGHPVGAPRYLTVRAVVESCRSISDDFN